MEKGRFHKAHKNIKVPGPGRLLTRDWHEPLFLEILKQWVRERSRYRSEWGHGMLQQQLNTPDRAGAPQPEMEDVVQNLGNRSLQWVETSLGETQMENLFPVDLD